MVSSSPVQSRLRYHLSNLRDPRHTRTRRYLLCDILLIVLCGLLSGADNFVSIAQWAEAKKDWLQEALGVAALPSHDTLGRVLSRLDADALNHCLLNWSQSLWTPEAGAVVAFDGKRLRGAMGNLTLLSAFATKTRLTLSVQKVAEGSNEIPALREALALLSLEGCVVTADALHCQVETAQAIVDKQADYVLALKRNQDELFETARQYFTFWRSEQFASDGRSAVPYQFTQSVDKARGQVETRRCWLITTTGWLDPLDMWPNLKSVALVERECRRRDGRVTVEARYFLTSLGGDTAHGNATAKQVMRAVRSHWKIENSQHWALDVAYKEDLCRLRVGNAAQNLATLRRLSLNLLKRDKSVKVGIATKRSMAGWNNDYLETLLAAA